MKNIKKFKVTIQSNIKDALLKINSNHKGICFVVDKYDILKGVITDGDIRRALLNGYKLNSKISKIIKRKFIYLNIKSEKKKITKYFNQAIRIIPLVNNNKKLVSFIEDDSKISLAKPSLDGNELRYLTNCINTGWISSTGKYVRLFEKKFSKYTKIKHSLAVSNGTVALQLAIKTLDIGFNDEVIVPNLTFASPVNAVIHAGAKPVFVDVNEKTFCIDENLIEKKISKRTKAIIVVHLYGHPANMKKIFRIANKYNLKIIEDCAEALSSFYNKKHVGNFGDVATFSFFGNKLITTGEGGMICFNSKKLRDKAEILRDHGMSKNKKYWHEQVGFNFRMTNIQGAIGCAQLERINWFVKQKNILVKNYQKELSKINFITLPYQDKNVINSYWLYTIKIDSNLKKYREKILVKMNSRGIETRPIFYPMNFMKPFKKYLNKRDKFPISKKLFETSISLPSAYDVKKNDVIKVRNFLKNYIFE